MCVFFVEIKNVTSSISFLLFFFVTNLHTHTHKPVHREGKKNDISTDRDMRKSRVQLQLYGKEEEEEKTRTRIRQLNVTIKYPLQYLHRIWLIRELDDVGH